jgi:Rrf2 family nitric oxide-sensitive transcriptional repressor
MQLNRQSDYALRSLLFLAVAGNECLYTIDDIAKKFTIAREHLTKIISKLAKLELIVATRGKGGGIKLNNTSLDLSLATIIKNFEPTFQVIDCHQLACPIRSACHLKHILAKASQAFLDTLDQYTLRDILPKSPNEQRSIATIFGIETRASHHDTTH